MMEGKEREEKGKDVVYFMIILFRECIAIQCALSDTLTYSTLLCILLP